jgi:hypothetical protein
LIIKASSGEVFKLPWAGNLAEKLAADSTLQSGASPTPGQAPFSPVAPSRGEIFRTRYYSFGHRAGRVTASAFAIAWSIALFIFFNFYHQYIAYYTRSDSSGGPHWQMQTLVTSDFNSWLPILNITLALTILGHLLMIVFDKYIVRQIARIILAVFGLATVITLLAIFPFNFDIIPNADASFWAPTGMTVLLLVIAVGLGIGALVRFITLMVHLAEGKY